MLRKCLAPRAHAQSEWSLTLTRRVFLRKIFLPRASAGRRIEKAFCRHGWRAAITPPAGEPDRSETNEDPKGKKILAWTANKKRKNGRTQRQLARTPAAWLLWSGPRRTTNTKARAFQAAVWMFRGIDSLAYRGIVWARTPKLDRLIALGGEAAFSWDPGLGIIEARDVSC